MTQTAKATTTQGKGTLKTIGTLLLAVGCIFLLVQVLGLFTGAHFRTLSQAAVTPAEEVTALMEEVSTLPEHSAREQLKSFFSLSDKELAELSEKMSTLSAEEGLAELEALHCQKNGRGWAEFLYYYVVVQGALVLAGAGLVLKNWESLKQTLRANEHHKTLGQLLMLVGALLLVNTLFLSVSGKSMAFFPMWQAPIGVILLGLFIGRAEKTTEKLAQGGVFHIIGSVMMLIGGFFAINMIATLITGGKFYTFLPYYVTMQTALALIVLGMLFKSLNKMVERVEKEGVQLAVGWVLVAATVLLSVNWVAMSLLGKPSGVATFPVMQILVVVFLIGLALCKLPKIVAAYKKGGARFVLSWLCLIVGVFFGLELLLKGIVALMDTDNAAKLFENMKKLNGEEVTKFKNTTAEYGYIFIFGYLKDAALYAGIGIAAFVLIRKFKGWHERTFTDTGYKLTQIGKAIHSVALVVFPFVLVYALIVFLTKGWEQAAVYAGAGVAGLLVAWIGGIALNSLGLVSMRNEKEAAKDVVVSWNCPECGAENPISIVKCKNCGHINP